MKKSVNASNKELEKKDNNAKRAKKVGNIQKPLKNGDYLPGKPMPKS